MEESSLIKIQDRLFEIGIIITNILEKNNIKYMISFGTLLGAVRHHNFIPWDDDFDLWIFNEDYDDAINVLRKELPKDLFLEDLKSEPKYFHSWAHVKDLRTIAESKHFIQDNEYEHKGLSIDLYRITKMEYGNINKYIYNEYIYYINRRLEKRLISIEEYDRRNKEAKEFLYKDNDEHEKEKTVYAFVTSYKNKYVLEEEVFPLKEILFRDHYFKCPKNPEAILKRLYGNYLTLPPEENRIQHYSKVKFI